MNIPVEYYMLPLILLTAGLFCLLLGVEYEGKKSLHWIENLVNSSLSKILKTERKQSARLAGIIIIFIGLALGVGIAILRFPAMDAQPQSPTPHLVKLGYMYGDWDPKYVDLAKADSEGIPIGNGFSFIFHYLYIKVPEPLPDGFLDIEIYGDDELIGQLNHISLKKGDVELFNPEIEIKNYQHPITANTWMIQPDWKNLEMRLTTSKGTRKISSETTTIRINPSGNAWYLSPSYASIASVVYTINDGSEQILDFRALPENGISISEGDKLSLTEVWYKTNTLGYDETQEITVDAYLSSGQYEEDTYKTSGSTKTQSGVHLLPGCDKLTWDRVDPDKTRLIVTLTRYDENIPRSFILDRLIIPINR